MSNTHYPVVHFRDQFDEYLWWEISQKGWYSGVVAELPGGRFYALTFYDAGRLGQELESEFERGEPCLAEQSLVVVPAISEATIRASVDRLFSQRWFEHLAASASVGEALHLVGAGL
jgi:hypothetical protein